MPRQSILCICIVVAVQYTQIVLLTWTQEENAFLKTYTIYTTLLLKNILWCIVQLGYILQCTKLLELLSKKFWEAKVGNTKASDLERLKVYLRQLIMEMPGRKARWFPDSIYSHAVIYTTTSTRYTFFIKSQHT